MDTRQPSRGVEPATRIEAFALAEAPAPPATAGPSSSDMNAISTSTTVILSRALRLDGDESSNQPRHAPWHEPHIAHPSDGSNGRPTLGSSSPRGSSVPSLEVSLVANPTHDPDPDQSSILDRPDPQPASTSDQSSWLIDDTLLPPPHHHIVTSPHHLPGTPLLVPSRASSSLSHGPPSTSATPVVTSNASFLTNAQDVHVQTINVQNNQLTTSLTPSQALFKYLSPHITHDAAHDSSERCDAPTCHEETRAAIREDIVSWIKDGGGVEEPKRIMWLSGPAGAGKTAIAGSIATACKKDGLLAASFFFSSFSAGRSSKLGLVATLAYHLSQHDALHHFGASLLRAIERRPDIFHKNLKEQAEFLIVEPFRVIQNKEADVGWPKVVIIDGLDEVVATQSTTWQVPRKSEDDQGEILHILLFLSRSTTFPFRIFIASRPESNIAEFFTTEAHASTIKLFLDAKYDPDSDIKHFLKSKFGYIRRRGRIGDTSWPGEEAVDRIVEMSSGQFIVPVTVLRWVESGIPKEQLDEILGLKPVAAGRKNPFAMLDALYRHILERAPTPDNDPHLVVKWILCITGSQGLERCARFWAQFLQDVDGEFNHRMAPIASLIFVPPPDHTPSCISVYHKSLLDFLAAEARCEDLYIDHTEFKSFVGDRIVTVLKNRGPAVPPSSPEALVRFLISFMVRLFIEDSTKFLAFLSAGSKDELASCDVAWWTTISLSVIHAGGTGLPDEDNVGILKSSEVAWAPHPWLAQRIYWRVHQAMGCDSNPPYSTDHKTQRGSKSRCHAACIHWRKGILAKAKELEWCVHELEQVDVSQLQNLSVWDISRKFKRMGRKYDGDPYLITCEICQKSPTNL